VESDSRLGHSRVYHLRIDALVLDELLVSRLIKLFRVKRRHERIPHLVNPIGDLQRINSV
jgi:hypothetical protein